MMEVTKENYEEVVNKLTIDLILRNGKLKERLERREWMTKTEVDIYNNEMNYDLMMNLMEYTKVNNIEIFEKGSTYFNYFDQYLTLEETLALLKNRGKKL